MLHDSLTRATRIYMVRNVGDLNNPQALSVVKMNHLMGMWGLVGLVQQDKVKNCVCACLYIGL